MDNKYLDIIDQIKKQCSDEEQFELIIIASILELSKIADEESFYNEKLIELKETPYETKFPVLYELLIELSKKISNIEKIDSDVILLEILQTFVDAYKSLND